MTAQPDPDDRKTRALAVAILRDPIVPGDLGGWARRTVRLWRSYFRPLAALAVIPALCGAAYQVVLDAVRPTSVEVQRGLAAAVAGAAGGAVSPGTVFAVKFGPMVPAMLGFLVVSLVISGFVQGAAFYLVLRRSNGQPAGVGAALRCAARRVAAYSGWLAGSGLVVLGVIVGLMLTTLTSGVPLLEVVCPLVAAVVVVAYLVVVVVPLSGVVFVERRPLPRCLQVIKGRWWATVVRTAVAAVVALAYVRLVGGVVTLLLAPFGGASSLSHPGLAAVHLLTAALTIPLTAFITTATLVSYAELRFHHDPATRTRTLADEIGR